MRRLPNPPSPIWSIHHVIGRSFLIATIRTRSTARCAKRVWGDAGGFPCRLVGQGRVSSPSGVWAKPQPPAILDFLFKDQQSAIGTGCNCNSAIEWCSRTQPALFHQIHFDCNKITLTLHYSHFHNCCQCLSYYAYLLVLLFRPFLQGYINFVNIAV